MFDFFPKKCKKNKNSNEISVISWLQPNPTPLPCHPISSVIHSSATALYIPVKSKHLYINDGW